MNILKIIYHTILDALFPLSTAEKELFSYSPEEALEKLPPAPTFDSSMNMHSIFAYKDDRVAKLVWNIKYKKSTQAVAIGGYALLRKLEKTKQERPIILIPMPITPKRRRERGFNQCELLVDELTRLDKNIMVEKNLLVRVQHSERQTLKGRMDRLESAKGIFAVNAEEIERLGIETLKDSTIIILDDVITTGSTMNEAIETVKKVGVQHVQGLSLAH